MSATTLYLASQSPRRAALLQLLGLEKVTIQSSDIPETMDPGKSAEENVEILSRQKALAVTASLTEGVVLGADTTVVIGNVILNKPRDAEDAERMLAMLSGAMHTVHTGVSLINVETKVITSFVESTDVTFRKLSTSEIKAYVVSGSPMDKAGAYGIQEDFGAVFVRRIDGDYYNVVGLPICRLYVTLKSFAPQVFK